MRSQEDNKLYGRESLPLSLLAQFFIIGSLLAIYVFYPLTFARLIAEDNWGEYSTFVAELFTAFIFFFLFFFKAGGSRNFWYLALGVGTFFVGMEEISWGQRLIGIPMPAFMSEVNFQNEIGIHNIRYGYEGISTTIVMRLVGVGMLVYGVILPILGKFLPKVLERLQHLKFPVPSLRLILIFFFAFYFLTSPLGYDNSLRKASEIGELFFGISFLFLAVEKLAHYCELRGTGYPLGILKFKRFLMPAFVIGVFGCGVVLTELRGPGDLERRRIDLVGANFPGLLELEQGSKIFKTLVEGEHSGNEALFVNRGDLLEKHGKTLEAKQSYSKAIQIILQKKIVNGSEPEDNLMLGILYSKIGEPDLGAQYLDDSIRQYLNALEQENLREEAFPKEVKRSWWEEFWENYVAGGAYPSKKIRIHRKLAEGYTLKGEFAKAVDEYFTVVKYSPRAKVRNQISFEISEALLGLKECDKSEVVKKPRVPWDRIKIMAKKYEEGSPDWCRTSGLS